MNSEMGDEFSLSCTSPHFSPGFGFLGQDANPDCSKNQIRQCVNKPLSVDEAKNFEVTEFLNYPGPPGEKCGLNYFNLQRVVSERFFLEQLLSKTSDFRF